MAADREIDYEALAQNALRGIVRTVLTRVAGSGLPGEHHFYIAFKTDAPGVVLSERLKQKYPEEMTVVLQHRFWDLVVEDARFEVKLTFDSIPERLVVPFSAIKVFFDPSVPYGLQFDEVDGGEVSAEQVGVARNHAERAAHGEAPEPAPKLQQSARPEKKPRTAKRSQADKASAERNGAADKAPAKPTPPEKSGDPASGASPKVVSIDAFRKK